MGITARELQQNWEQIIREAGEQYLSLRALLYAATPTNCGRRSFGGPVVVRLEVDHPFHLGLLRAPDRRRVVAEVLSRRVGEPVRIDWALAPQRRRRGIMCQSADR